MPYGITQCYLQPSSGDSSTCTPAEAGTWFTMYVMCAVFVLDVFKPDENFTENEEKYKQLKKGNFLCSVVYKYICLLIAY